MNSEPVSHVLGGRHRPRVPGPFLASSLILLTLAGSLGPTELPRGRVKPTLGSGLALHWHRVPELPEPVAQFATVFWEPRDTESLRQRIAQSTDMRGQVVLEIGTGTGLLALCCLRAGAAKVIATDINPHALENARHNAERHGFADRLELRLVSPDRPSAFAVIGPTEAFDLIVSNPPWEEGTPRQVADYALYDPAFGLLWSLIADSADHLRPGGRIWLAYGSVAAIDQIRQLAPRHGWRLTSQDSRELTQLPPVFLPGMLLELTR